VGLRAGLDGCLKSRPYWDSIPGPSDQSVPVFPSTNSLAVVVCVLERHTVFGSGQRCVCVYWSDTVFGSGQRCVCVYWSDTQCVVLSRGVCVCVCVCVLE